ncbi:hypothetical protein ACLI4Y_13505 [Natrialbaceae archaeon A-CW3]
MTESRVSSVVRAVRLIGSVRHRVELRHRRKHPQLVAAVLLGATFGTLLVVGSVPLPVVGSLWPEPGAYHYGTIAATESDLVLALTRELAAIVLVASAGLGALSATTSDDWEQPPVELVTAVSLPVAIAGVLVDELLESGWFVGPVVLGGVLAFTAGTGEPLSILGAAVGGGAILVTGLLTGTAVGIALRASIRRSPRLYAARYGISVVVLFVLFLGLSLSRTAGATLAATPLGWYGDLLLATTPALEAVPSRAALALTGTLVVLPLALGLAVVGARSLWFAEAVLDDGTVDDAERGRFRRLLEAGLERQFGRETAGATRTVWHRMRRSPRAMVYVVLPLAFVGPVTVEVSSAAPSLLPALVSVYVASAVGLGTTLNPLGNERVALPLVQTTPGGEDAVLRGHALAALVPGLPIVLAVSILIGTAVGYPTWTLLAFGLAIAAVTVGGIGLSLALGAYLPNLEGPTEASLAPPELYAMLAYLAAMVVLSSPLFVGFGTGVALVPVGAAVTAGVSALVAGSVGVGGYRYARLRLGAFEDG